jgi:hypothetical protein
MKNIPSSGFTALLQKLIKIPIVIVNNDEPNFVIIINPPNPPTGTLVNPNQLTPINTRKVFEDELIKGMPIAHTREKLPNEQRSNIMFQAIICRFTCS